ncbi:MAG TPA: aldose epimerase family protein [Rhizomicrobium sp.]|nr:aldose epimerase family protein [Rhizomicrobium sp.]
MRTKTIGTALFLAGFAGSAVMGSAWAGTVETANYGVTKDGTTVHAFTLTNNHGMRAQVLDYGGLVCDVEAPGRDGKLANVILCQKDLKAIEASGPMSALTGRYANRLLHGFTVDGKHYDLQANPAGVTLHGGPPAYSRRILQTVGTFRHANDAGVTLRLASPDGDQGFPGALAVDVTYTLTDNNDFRIDYKATTDKPTVVNLTNHTYYNLAGGGSVEPQIMTIMADQVTPTDVNQVPTGELATVAGTALDFRTPKPIGRDLRSSEPQMLIGRGYDHNYVLRKSRPGALELAARITDPASGRTLELSTTEPGVQVYSSNNLNGGAVNALGQTLRATDGLALETQHFPDSPNHPNFPSTELKPGETFASSTVMHFTVQ